MLQAHSNVSIPCVRTDIYIVCFCGEHQREISREFVVIDTPRYLELLSFLFRFQKWWFRGRKVRNFYSGAELFFSFCRRKTWGFAREFNFRVLMKRIVNLSSLDEVLHFSFCSIQLGIGHFCGMFESWHFYRAVVSTCFRWFFQYDIQRNLNFKRTRNYFLF